jgi:hypothetical protein
MRERNHIVLMRLSAHRDKLRKRRMSRRNVKRINRLTDMMWAICRAESAKLPKFPHRFYDSGRMMTQHLRNQTAKTLKWLRQTGRKAEALQIKREN